ncbi:hypothetical protein Tco_1031534 [Tanacetum coccineum]|uniref:Uncharacterized protein n=1 Tax=Tanacetum coccineum TaxID=301880 RepID=A0ABQ5GAZ4_9ASTR
MICISSKSNDTGADHLFKDQDQTHNWFEPILEEKRETPKPTIGKSKLSKADLEGPNFKIRGSDQSVGTAYGIAHWWFKRKKFYITRHSAPSDHRAVRSYIKILRLTTKTTRPQESRLQNLHPNILKTCKPASSSSKSTTSILESDKVLPYSTQSIL